MTDKPTKPGKEQPKPTRAGGGKKPYATLNLKAKEVKEAPSKAFSATSLEKPTSKSGKAPTEAEPKAQTRLPAAEISDDRKPKADDDTSGKTQSDASGAKAKPETKTTATAPPPKPSSGSSGSYVGRFFSILLAAILGGLFALLGADQLAQRLGLDAGGKQPSTLEADLAQRLSSLEQSIASGSPGPSSQDSAKIATLESRLSDLEKVREAANRIAEDQAKIDTRAASLEERVKKSEAEDGAADARLQRLEQQLATLSAAAGTNTEGSLPQLAAITGRLADLEAALDTQTKSLRTSIGREVESRIGVVAEASEAARSGTARIDRQLASVQSDTARIGEKVDALTSDSNKMAGQLDVVKDTAGKLDTALDRFKRETANDISLRVTRTDLKTSLTEIEEQLAGLDARVASVIRAERDRKENAKRIVLAIELANLKRRLDRGEKFSAELSQVKSVAGGLLDLSALEKHQSDGVPNLDDLQTSFRNVAHAVIDAETAPGDDASVIDRLLAGAKSIVRVRRVDHDASDQSAEAVVGRMEAALKAGQLEQVLREAGALSAQTADHAQNWLEQVEARHSVDKALHNLERQLKASLVGPDKPETTEPEK